MQLDSYGYSEGGALRRRLRPALVWGGLVLLATVAVALAIVVASLALELGSEPTPRTSTPPATAPLQLGPSVGHQRPE
jgi:hypothetical protein